MTTAKLDITRLQTQPNQVVYGAAEFEWRGEQFSLTVPGRTGCILG
jgi:hypothetical protein